MYPTYDINIQKAHNFILSFSEIFFIAIKINLTNASNGKNHNAPSPDTFSVNFNFPIYEYEKTICLSQSRI